MTTSLKSTPEFRRASVRQTNANAAIEGFAPDSQDKELQAAYVAGTATTNDMLRHALAFAADKKATGK